MEWKCPVCGKEFEHFGIKEFALAPKTTLFGTFKIKDINGDINTVDRKMNKLVCSEECKQKNENQYFDPVSGDVHPAAGEHAGKSPGEGHPGHQLNQYSGLHGG